MAGGMRIVTNVAALQGVVANTNNSSNLQKSLERLSTGLKINAAKDNASGLAIANQLKTQASSLKQAIDNGNQANSMMLTADKAIDEQSNILDQIKTKAIAAAQDGQNTKTRNMLQADIVRLMEELDNIANTTSFNGKMLLSGGFINQEFQVGDRSNITVKATVGSTQSSKLGLTRFETGLNITSQAGGGTAFTATGGSLSQGKAASIQGLTLKNYDGRGNDWTFGTVKLGYKVNEGLGALAEEMNKASAETGVRATAIVQSKGIQSVKAGSTSDGFSINGVLIGKLTWEDNDRNGSLVNGINAYKDTTGVTASIDGQGKLILNSADGRGIYLKVSAATQAQISNMGLITFAHATTTYINFGRLSLVKNNGSDIVFDMSQAGGTNSSFAAALIGYSNSDLVSQYTMSLRESKGAFDALKADATGMNGTKLGAGLTMQMTMVMALSSASQVAALSIADITSGVTTLKGAMAVMDIVETAILNVDQIRADIGSVQQQIDSTITNISTTQVNLKAAESVIRDVDFADESANYSKSSILAQSGAYALAQANASSQYVMQLLQ